MSAAQKNDLQQQALHAFQRDLTHLWAERAGQWVAYQGDQQLGFASRKHELYQQCFHRGLRREELATLAGISSDYYLRLEQGRDKNPSAQILDALARALQLDVKATEYLHQLASSTSGRRDRASRWPQLFSRLWQ